MIAHSKGVDWDRVEVLFHDTLELGESARLDYLRDQCGNDAALFQAVRRLLDGHAIAASDFVMPLSLASLSLRGGASSPCADDESAAHMLGRRIGSFTLNRLIAVGGIGAVYEAHQQRPRRVVAVKLLRGGLTTPEAVRRFEYEAEVLARLQHPNIARVYEAGHFIDGTVEVPYFALEYVEEAQTLIEFADARRLDTRDRVRLLTVVCDAVHHAHQRGVIHRDIKPGNVLLDADGCPKVIDFGVARVTDLDPGNTLETRAGQIIGTLPYMSPEQIDAVPGGLDTRTDVYSLGVLLYELLTGELPFDVRHVPIVSASRMIRDERPTRLSVISSALAGDLETIVHKSMEKERDHRYQSVAELRADLGRYLRNEPITAHPPTLAYQLRKFYARHMWLCTAATGLIVTIVVLAVTSYAQSLQIAKERDLVAVEAANADRSSAFLRSILGYANPRILGRDVTMRDAVDAAERRVADELGDSPVVESEVRGAIGSAYFSMSRFGEAEKQYRLAWDRLRSALGEAHTDTVAALIQYTQVVRWRGMPERAAPLIQDAIRALHDDRGSENTDMADLQLELARAQQGLGRYEQATETLFTARNLLWRLLGPEHTKIAGMLQAMADVAWDSSEVDKAIQYLREALDMRRQLQPIDAIEVTDTMYDLGFMLTRADPSRPAEAEEILRERLSILRSWGDENIEVAVTLSVLSSAVDLQGRTGEAESLLMEALDMKRRVVGDDHYEVANTLASVGAFYNNHQRYAVAEPYWRDALDLRNTLFGPQHFDTVQTVCFLGDTLESLHRMTDAEFVYRRHLLDAHSVDGPRNDHWICVAIQLGRNLARQHRAGEAIGVLGEAYQRLQLTSPGDPQIAEVTRALASVMQGWADSPHPQSLSSSQ